MLAINGQKMRWFRKTGDGMNKQKTKAVPKELLEM
jgi:hypothetical protein